MGLSKSLFLDDTVLNMIFSPTYHLPAAVVVLCALTLFFLPKNQRGKIVKWISPWLAELVGGRDSNSTTSPNDLPSEEKAPQNAPAPASYKDAFPPSTRERIYDAGKHLPREQREKLQNGPASEAEFSKNLIPFTADYRECGPSTYTPTEISVEEVEALGDFPDYAALGDVPLPEPYREFDITKAIPRPYRPFRWAYHQTMCE